MVTLEIALEHTLLHERVLHGIQNENRSNGTLKTEISMIRLKNTSYQMAPPRTTLAAPTLLGKCLLVHTIMKVCVNQKEVTVLINTTTKLKKNR